MSNEIVRTQPYTLSELSEAFDLSSVLEDYQLHGFNKMLADGDVAGAQQLVNRGIAQRALTNIFKGGLFYLVVYVGMVELFAPHIFTFTGHHELLTVLGGAWFVWSGLVIMSANDIKQKVRIQPKYNPIVKSLYTKCLDTLYELQENTIWKNPTDYPEVERFDISQMRTDVLKLADSVQSSLTDYELNDAEVETLPDFKQLTDLTHTMENVLCTIKEIEEMLKQDLRRKALQNSTAVVSLELTKDALNRNYDYANTLDEVFEKQKELERGDDDE